MLNTRQNAISLLVYAGWGKGWDRTADLRVGGRPTTSWATAAARANCDTEKFMCAYPLTANYPSIHPYLPAFLGGTVGERR